MYCWLDFGDGVNIPMPESANTHPDRDGCLRRVVAGVNSLQRYALSRGTRLIALPLLIAWSCSLESPSWPSAATCGSVAT